MTKKDSIKVVKEKLASVTSQTDPYFRQLQEDDRKGIQKLLATWEKNQIKQAEIKERAEMILAYEHAAQAKGYKMIAGIDEVGRGPLAGPVVAAAVILPKDFELLEVDDSKKLSEKKRDMFYDLILEQAVSVGIGIIDEKIIDKINIYEATKEAMKMAVAKLSFPPDYLLIDAMKLESLPIPQESIIKGDAKSVSIASASIIAKVTRDRLMTSFDNKYPGYGFANNAGYGTKEHLEGLEKLGPCEIHRETFSPVKKYLDK